VLSAGAAAQETRIAAIVNDDVVSADDLANRIILVMRSSNMKDAPENRKRISAQVLRALIDERLEMQEAKRLNVVATKQEIDEAMRRIEQQNNMPKGGLDEFLTKAGIARASLVDQISAGIAWAKLVRNRLSQDVTISDDQVTEALAQLKARSDEPQNRVSEIFLAIDNPTQEAEIKQLADRLVEQVQSGVKFDALARQFSQSPTAAVGGDLGWVSRSQLLPALADAVKKMNPNEMSYPVRAGGGYYLLYLRERRTVGAPDPDDTVLSVVQVILPLWRELPAAGAAARKAAARRGAAEGAQSAEVMRAALSPEEQRRVMARAQQISETVKSCGELAKIGREEAPQTSREIPEIRVGDVPADRRQLMLKLAVGEASKPLPGQGGIGIVMVCSKKDPTGGLPTRDEMADMMAREKLDTLARRYLRDLRRNSYVDIRG
jgi:peptidyl-prolyl cis-trans isomerase SurA